MKRWFKFGLIFSMITLAIYLILESIIREIFIPLYIFKDPIILFYFIGPLILGFLIGVYIHFLTKEKGSIIFGIVFSLLALIIELLFGSIYTVTQGLSLLLTGLSIGLIFKLLFVADENYNSFSDIKKTFTISGVLFIAQLIGFIFVWGNVFNIMTDSVWQIVSTYISIPIGDIFWLFTQMSNSGFGAYILLTILCLAIFWALLFLACLLGIKLFKKMRY